MKKKYISGKEEKEYKEFHRRMEDYGQLPVEERLEKYRTEVRDVEARILALTGDPVDGDLFSTLNTDEKMGRVNSLLKYRYYALSKMFELHCSDAEVKRIEDLNTQLLDLTKVLFDRTAKVYRGILDMPGDDGDDDLSVEGELLYMGESSKDILQLEDDAFYGSDFRKMILILSYLETEFHGDLPVISCRPNDSAWREQKSSMTDKELGFEHWMDDGTTWAESWLYHPRLQHLVICYAMHALVTHKDYCIPDLMRLNCFEVRVKTEFRRDSEQDGSRLGWSETCSEQQFMEKFRHEAEHRPVEMSEGEFIYRRVCEYFGFEQQDELDRETVERFHKQSERWPEMGKNVDLSIYPGNRMETLPDCSKDDSRIEAFLKTAYSLQSK